MAFNLTIPTVSLGTFGEVHIYLPKTPLSQGQIDSCVAAVLSTMKQPFDANIDAASVVFSLLSLSFPPFVDEMKKLKSVKVVTHDLTIDHVMSAFGAGNVIQEDAVERLPLTGDVLQGVFSAADTLPVFCGLSVLLFCLGKNVDRTTPTAFTDGRPSALIRKYGLTGSQTFYMPDAQYGPTMAVINQIATSFVEYPEVKSMIARLLLSQLYVAHTTPPMQCIITAFKLLKGSQLAHTQAIIECCVANPWIVNIPDLRPDLMAFSRDLKILSTMPEESRWFVKLLTSDNNAVMVRSNFRRLSAVAVDWKKSVEPTFLGYAGDDQSYATTIQVFKSYQAAGVGGVIEEDSLFAALGLPRTSLPDKPEGAPSQAAVI